MAENILQELARVIESRRRQRPANSYVVQLLDQGAEKIAAKLEEELRELIAAGREPETSRRSHVVHEAADLVFHLLVLLGHTEVEWSAVEEELGRRFGVGGLVEKAAREKKPQ